MVAPSGGSPIAYLSRKEVAERLGIKPDSLSRAGLPEPDAVIGEVRGWLPETIAAWRRPGQGTRTDLDEM